MNNAAELLRLIQNLIRLGTIAEVDHDAARVRVKSGDLLTGWLPWADARAGTTRTWSPPTIGEQVLVFAPGGDTENSVALTALYQTAHPAPSSSADVFHAAMPDGAVFEYDHATHRMTAQTGPSSIVMDRQKIRLASNGSSIKLDASGITLNGSRIDLN